MPAINSYALFAKYYDQLNFNSFSNHAVHYLNDILATLNFDGTKILDVACGTGTSSIWFAEKGYQVTGIDISPQMIRMAKRKHLSSDVNIHFLVRDMRTMQFKKPFDLAICMFDSLNHLTSYRAFETALKNISANLVPRGSFIFDLITPYELSMRWNNIIRHETNGKVSLLLKSHYDKKIKRVEIQGDFLIKTTKKVLRYTRYFHNKAYTKTEINKAIRKSGLKLLHQYDYYSFEKPFTKSCRICYITQKII